jgi:hypothetical protein
VLFDLDVFSAVGWAFLSDAFCLSVLDVFSAAFWALFAEAIGLELFVDADCLFTSTWTASTDAFFFDSDVFFTEAVGLSLFNFGVAGFSTFPSDARSPVR